LRVLPENCSLLRFDILADPIQITFDLHGAKFSRGGLTRSSLACIIRERHATEGFGRQRIAEEEDGSVKLMRGTWLQALQAHTIEVATILGRGFALCSFGSGENGNSSGERS
jgi:hypothetical protein